MGQALLASQQQQQQQQRWWWAVVTAASVASAAASGLFPVKVWNDSAVLRPGAASRPLGLLQALLGQLGQVLLWCKEGREASVAAGGEVGVRPVGSGPLLSLAHWDPPPPVGPELRSSLFTSLQLVYKVSVTVVGKTESPAMNNSKHFHSPHPEPGIVVTAWLLWAHLILIATLPASQKQPSLSRGRAAGTARDDQPWPSATRWPRNAGSLGDSHNLFPARACRRKVLELLPCM